MSTDALERILSARKRRVEQQKKDVPQAALREKLSTAPVSRDFYGALIKRGCVGLIAEMKRQSPSAGRIRDPYVPRELAQAYERGGANALSVLTEPEEFLGDLAHLQEARSACSLPVLRKDFIFDEYQILEARVAGADAVLLIAEMLPADRLAALALTARNLGIEPLVEIFSEESLPAALAAGTRMIGINTRNLRTLEMRPDNVATLSRKIKGVAVVAESGIKTPADVAAIKALGVAAMLVGESLLKQKDVEAATRALAEAGAQS